MVRVIHHICARSDMWTIAALETGVERRADVMCLPEPPNETGEIGISHLAPQIRKSKRVWTAIRKRSGLVVDERTCLSRGANDEVMATDFRRRGENIT